MSGNISWLISIVMFACGSSLMNSRMATAADPAKALEPLVFKSGDQSLQYRLLKPVDYDADKKYPLVLLLHGAGERGSDNRKQLVHGIADFTTDQAMRDRPCFVVAPQCPSGQKWVNVDWSSKSHTMPEQPAASLRLTMELLESLEKEFSIDSSRLYITGLSMGGYGTWDAIQRYPNRFAAAIPICGGGDLKQTKQIATLPIWAFHGAKDNVVSISRSRDMIETLKKAGGSPKYTEYPKAGHNSWAATYRDPKVHEWLFQQVRKTP
jgi:predicted peptidase